MISVRHEDSEHLYENEHLSSTVDLTSVEMKNAVEICPITNNIVVLFDITRFGTEGEINAATT